MIYLDNAATSFPKAPGVAQAVSRQVLEIGGNPGRASHRMAREASGLLYDAREEMAALLGVGDPERLAFTKNATEAINLALLGTVRPGELVATSSLEHNSVMRPLRWLEASRGVKIAVFPCDECGRPDPAELRRIIGLGPALAVFSMASNVTGAILPVGEILSLCREAGVPVGLDASQAVGHMAISIAELDPLFFCFSGHKGLLGPTGTGGLYAGHSQDREPLPLIRGGTGSFSESEVQPEILPDRYEAGTQNLLGLAGLRASLRFLRETGLDAVRGRETALSERLLRGLAELPGVRLYGPPAQTDRVPVISATFEGFDQAEIALELDRRDIAVRMGLQCSPAAHRSIGTFSRGGTIRFSPGFFTTEADIDDTLEALRDILSAR